MSNRIVLGLISCFTLNAAICCVGAIYWICQNFTTEEIQELQKALLLSNWFCILPMWFAATILAIYSIVIASKDGIASVGSDTYDVTKSFAIGALLLFYFLGKYALYIILYIYVYSIC